MARTSVCMLSSEIVPYAKTGGLADVVGALIGELAVRGHEVRGFMPLYGAVRGSLTGLEPVAPVADAELRIGETAYRYDVRAGTYPGTGATMYFVDCPALFDRPSFYTTDPDEHRRFILFSRAVLETCRRVGFAPDVFHCNDWHTGFLPLYLRTLRRDGGAFAHSRTLLTIHNIGYQGVMPASAFADVGIEDPGMLDAEDLAAGTVSALRTGIRHADRVSTVSPTYAREICDTALGMGMERTLRARHQPVAGILNGVDYREWDPRHDPYLEVHYGADELAGKARNRRRLLEDLSLALDDSRPLIGMVSRLAEQKGFDLLAQVLPAFLAERECGFVALGSGDARYSSFLADLARRFPTRVAFSSGHDELLAHRIEAASDVFLMPSRYEPCGLNQMYSLRYGTIPVVRRTGGLADSVRHFDPATGEGTGCVFNDYDAPAVRWALETVLGWFADPALWGRIVRNAMREDFSWARQVAQYEALYRGMSAETGAASRP